MNQQEDVNEVQIGRILHFVIDKGWPQCRPALVVEDWPNSGKPGYVNLAVFPDGTNDNNIGVDRHRHNLGSDHVPEFTAIANVPLLVIWETSVLPNHAVRAIRTWHWPRWCKSLHEPQESIRDEFNQRRHHNHSSGTEDIHNCDACRYLVSQSNVKA